MNQHGGKRDRAGRKPKRPTKVISFRVDADKADYIKILVNKYLTTI